MSRRSSFMGLSAPAGVERSVRRLVFGGVWLVTPAAWLGACAVEQVVLGENLRPTQLSPQPPQATPIQEASVPPTPPDAAAPPAKMDAAPSAFPEAGPPPVVEDASPGLPPWQPPDIVSVSVTGQNDQDPSLTADMLQMFFISERGGGKGRFDLWGATRKNLDAPWGAARPLSNLNSADADTSPEVSGDGLTLWYSTGKAGHDQLFVATRETRDQNFGNAKRVTELNTPDNEIAPAVTQDGRIMFFARRRGHGDLYETTRAALDAAWGKPTPRGELNTEGDEFDPTSADGLHLFFTRDRNLYEAWRESTGQPFGEVRKLSEINSAKSDHDPWISPDGRVLYFASNRSGKPNIYVSRR